MRRPLPLGLNDEQRVQLERWGRGGSTPYRLVMRSRMVLLAAHGLSNLEVARILDTNPNTVARWRSRFTLLGVEGIRREAPRSGSPPPVPDEVVRRIVEKTLHERPSGRARWSTRSLAREIGVSHTTVRRIWKDYGIRPGRSRVAMLAQDPRRRPEELDLVGVYVNPPQRAAALWLGNDAQPARRERRPTPSDPPSSSASPGQAWMADLVTTLNLLDRREPIPTSRRCRDQEFLSFLRSVHERRIGKEKIVLLGEPSGPTLSPTLRHWLNRHPRISAEVCTGADQWKQKIVASIREVQEHSPTRTPPAGLPGFLRAVNQWDREGEGRPRPFAWTEDPPHAPGRPVAPVRPERSIRKLSTRNSAD